MTGYIQANILGKQRGLKFGSLAAQQITLRMVKMGAETGEIYSAPLIANVIYWGLYNNAFAKNEVLEVSFEEVVDWVDEEIFNKDMEQTFTDILKCYEESKHTKIAIEKVTEMVDEVKKKMTESTSLVSLDGITSEALPSDN